MPHKFNADRRDKIPKQKQRVAVLHKWADGIHCMNSA
jgi:hypothetical protein